MTETAGLKPDTSISNSSISKYFLFFLWLKFNLVGAVGVAVQLAALALFNRWFRGHYLFATIAALEVTLLHNFAWHLRFTWRDHGGPTLTRLLHFQLSNGLVSLAGNLLLMRLLVSQAHLPVLVANGIAILCCSVANFLLSHWIFAGCAESGVAHPTFGVPHS